MQKRSGGKLSIDYNVIGEADTKIFYGTFQKSLPGGIFAVSRPIRFYIRIGSTGCCFGFKSLYWTRDVTLSVPSLDC